MADHGIEARLAKIEMRQEVVIKAIEELAGLVGDVRDLVTELQSWAQEPPSTNLGDTLLTLVQSVAGMHETLIALGREMPGRVAETLAK